MLCFKQQSKCINKIAFIKTIRFLKNYVWVVVIRFTRTPNYRFFFQASHDTLEIKCMSILPILVQRNMWAKKTKHMAQFNKRVQEHFFLSKNVTVTLFKTVYV